MNDAKMKPMAVSSDRLRSITPRSTDERFRLFVDSVRDYAMFLLDPEGRVLTWNTGATRIKGYTADEIIGQHFSRFYPPEDLAIGKPAAELEIAAAEGRVEDEGWRLRKDGTRFWANVVISALRGDDGKLLGFAKVTRDLTERRRIEDALKRSEERLRLLVDSVKDYAIFMLAPDGTVASWNGGAERLHGYRADEIIGEHFSRFYTEPDILAGKPETELRVATLEGRYEDEGWRLRKDGTRFWANVVVTALRDSNGQLFGFAKVTRDLTERRNAEEDRLRRARAEEALRVRDEFLSVASHELRTPISTLRLQADGLIRVLQKGEGAITRERILERVQKVGGEIGRLERLVHDLLEVTRITSGRIVLQPAPVDLAQLTATALERLGDHLEAASCPVTFRAEGDTTGLWDADRIDQVVVNLLTNAAKYGRGAPIMVDVVGDEGTVQLRVHDSGIGIPADQLQKIFERFERAADAKHYGGFGLGLWIARQLVEAHRGAIRAESVEGEGATFVVTLPRK
jgi:PAS domain S-box-containing protein